ncbi:MAG TPA: Nramp family divalent metal transporter [Actinomycetes bacterium]|nr:Nramp family divalent metal transporter [Actinomycetes bacterium]
MTGREVRQRRLAQHPHRRLLRGHGYWKRLGPGIVTGAADDDPSGIGTYSQVGAAFGFGLLWTTLATLPLAIAVQEATARLGLVTGKGLAALIRERFARPVLWGAVVLVAVANTFNIGADIGSMAAAAGLLVPVPYVVATIAFAMVMVVLEVAVPYHRYARVLRWLALSLLAYVGVLVVVHVDWAAALAHTLVPRLPPGRAGLAALLAIFGTTISPYLFFWQAGEEIEEQAERHDPVDRDHLAAMRLDVAAGMGSGVGVMFAIMVTAAVTLGAHGVVQVNTAQQAAQALRPLAGNLAGLLFAAGIVGTGLLAVPVLAGSTAYAVAEMFGWREGLGRRVSQARAFYAVIAASILAGLAMDFVGIGPIRALYLAAILNGVAAPPLILLILLLARSKAVLGQHRSGLLSQLLVGGAAVVMAALSLLVVLP